MIQKTIIYIETWFTRQAFIKTWFTRQAFIKHYPENSGMQNSQNLFPTNKKGYDHSLYFITSNHKLIGFALQLQFPTSFFAFVVSSSGISNLLVSFYFLRFEFSYKVERRRSWYFSEDGEKTCNVASWGRWLVLN